ncbi:MAG: DUF3299 domain-containing protein [Nitrospinae bacterium]|nr:DUF3299 domain-containing protein [Nitrospinota bacterium]
MKEGAGKPLKRDIASLILLAVLFFIVPWVTVKEHAALMPGRHLGNLAAGSVPWETLAKVKINYVTEQNRIFSVEADKSVLALNGALVKVTGFITPMEPGTRIKRLIVSKYAPSCFFCPPSGPDAMVFVEPVEAMAYTQDPVTVKGTLVFDREMTDGIIYRLRGATLG